MSKHENQPRDLVQTLRNLGPEKVLDGYELCLTVRWTFAGISMDGETIMHCSTCHDEHAVAVEDVDRWREQMRKRRATNG
jgi:hypothetical protein